MGQWHVLLLDHLWGKRDAPHEENRRADLPTIDCHINPPQEIEEPKEPHIIEDIVVVEQQPAINVVTQGYEKEACDDDEQQKEDVEQQHNHNCKMKHMRSDKSKSSGRL